MVNYSFINSEEELFHVIRTGGTTFEDYKKVVEKVRDINYTDCNDTSFLHAAVHENKIDVAVDLMQRGIDVDIQTVGGYTAAQQAVANNQWEMLGEILKYHPNVNLKDLRNGNSLLWDVVCYKSEIRNQIAKQLLEMGAVGRFQNGESFSIYLPDAYKKDGNAQSYSDVLPIKRIGQYLETCGLDEAWLDRAADLPGEEMKVEMAV